MEPRFLISKGDLKKKAKAFHDYRMTKHRAASAVGLFAKKPWVRSKPDSTVQPLIVVRDRVESQRMLELAGVVSKMTSAPIEEHTPVISLTY
jgi:hypothetical protein